MYIPCKIFMHKQEYYYGSKCEALKNLAERDNLQTFISCSQAGINNFLF